MTKDEIGEIFENIARLLELKGENSFKIRAYGNAVRALETLPEDLETLVEEQRIGDVEGIGKSIAEKITELVRTGKLAYYDDLREQFPPDILTLFELQGLGGKKIKALYEKLGVSSITALERACQDGRIASLEHFGEKSAENFLKAIEQKKKRAERFLLSDVVGLVDELLEQLRHHPHVAKAEIAGSYRRSKETVGDLDIIVSTRKPELVGKDFVSSPLVEGVLAQGKTKISVMLAGGIQCDVRMVTKEEYPFAMVYFTGSKEHNVHLRGMALEHGWSLNEYRFSVVEGRNRGEEIPHIESESDLYRALGLDYIEPELREDRDEFDAAKEGRLPKLVEWHNLRGTFHCHTTASDGRSTLEDMAKAAQDLGLEYLGIADHSKSAIQAHGLDEQRLNAQVKQIRELNKSFDGFRLFAGTECDILKDGSLDFADDVLAQLDYVVASIHSSFSLSEAEMTKRIIKAITNPYVTILGHMTGRLLLTREPYAVNVPAVIEAAVDTNTLIELNANPRRLDLDWRWWHFARDKGLRCVINPDAHSVAGIKDLAFGVRIARKGWLRREDVLNCLPLEKVTKAIGIKKAGLI